MVLGVKSKHPVVMVALQTAESFFAFSKVVEMHTQSLKAEPIGAIAIDPDARWLILLTACSEQGVMLTYWALLGIISVPCFAGAHG